MHRKKLKYLFPLLVSFAVANAQEQPVATTTDEINDAIFANYSEYYSNEYYSLYHCNE